MRRELWGILGGMGPLASAEFLKTIYLESAAAREQEAPAVILLSDPAFPDRTACLEHDEQHILVEHLTRSLDHLSALRVTAVVICCVTLHAVLPELPEALGSGIVSLIDVMFSGLRATGQRHLMLCTSGCRVSRVFEKHPCWPILGPSIVLPADEDQQRVHDAIYEIKSGRMRATHFELIGELTSKYHTSSWIAGCTEMHIVQRRWRERPQEVIPCIDPLQMLAARIAGGEARTAAS